MKKKSVILISLISALGGLLFGFDTAVISGTIQMVSNEFILDANLEGWFVSSALLGCVIGVILAGIASDIFGRKKVLVTSAILFLVSAIGCAQAQNLTPLILYRIIGGAGIGFASIISPMYIAELSPAKIRGRLVSMYQLAITIGILSAYLSNAAILNAFSNNNHDAWRWMFGSEIIPASLFLILLFFIPESPRWLLSKSRTKEAKEILNNYLSEQEAETQINFSLSEDVKSQNPLKLWSQKKLIYLLLIGVTLASLSQLSGINAIIYFGPEILSNAGLTLGESLGGQVTIGIVNVIFTLVAIWKIDSWGRKPLLLSGIIGVIISLSLCAAYFMLQLENSVLLISFITLFIACFAFSYGPVTWIVIAEIYPTKIRGSAMSIATLSLWVTNVLIAQFFPTMNDWSTGGTFLVFAGISLVAFGFVYYFIPETKNKSLEDLEKQLSS